MLLPRLRVASLCVWMMREMVFFLKRSLSSVKKRERELLVVVAQCICHSLFWFTCYVY